MVYEEKVLSGYEIAPLQAVGWEGIYHTAPKDFSLVSLKWFPEMHTFCINNSQHIHNFFKDFGDSVE